MGDVITLPPRKNAPLASLPVAEPERLFGEGEPENVTPPRSEFGLKPRKASDLAGCLTEVLGALRGDDKAQQQAFKDEARARRPSSPDSVCRSLKEAAATEFSLIAEICSSRAATLKGWGDLDACVAALEIASKLETLSAHILLGVRYPEQD